MDTIYIGTIVALLVGVIAGAVLVKLLTASQTRSVMMALSDKQTECDTLRDATRTAELSEAKAKVERDAAVATAQSANNSAQDATAKIEGLTADVSTLQAKNAELMANLAGSRADVRSKDEELARQKAWFGEQSTHLQSLFGNTANSLLTERAAQFGEQNKTQIGELLQPFKEQLADFRRRVDEIHSSEATVRGQLQHQVEHLALTASQVGTKADQLANAMLGNVKQQGEWGQLQLTTLLEKAGFQEGKHFDNQFSGQSDEDELRIADTVLRLPNKETLVIDAKVSLPSWKRFCDTEDPAERELALGGLVTSIKAHYQSLASKDYARIVGKGVSVPFTVMFIPIEAAGIEAFRAAPELFNEAQKKKVIIITPTTLFCVLQLVTALWNIHDRQSNAMEIADQGRLMLKKLGGFMESFASVGSSLDSAYSAFEKAKGQLQTGRGNLVSLATTMAGLGVDAPAKGELAALIAKANLEEGDAEVIPIPNMAGSGDQNSA